jgi:hypothetical protein
VFSPTGDLKALTKWQKEHPAGADIPAFFETCEADDGCNSDGEDCKCQHLTQSWRNFAVKELSIKSWEEGTVNLYMVRRHTHAPLYIFEHLVGENIHTS